MSSPKSKCRGCVSYCKGRGGLNGAFSNLFLSKPESYCRLANICHMGIHPVLFAVCMLARSCGVELVWPASSCMLPHGEPPAGPG